MAITKPKNIRREKVKKIPAVTALLGSIILIGVAATGGILFHSIATEQATFGHMPHRHIMRKTLTAS